MPEERARWLGKLGDVCATHQVDPCVSRGYLQVVERAYVMLAWVACCAFALPNADDHICVLFCSYHTAGRVWGTC